MAVLSLDTATDVVAVCVCVELEAGAALAPVAESAVGSPLAPLRGAAQRVLGDVHHLLRQAELTPADLRLIVAGTGPGTFTGLRIGLATARALGGALAIPVRGVSTLDALLAGGADVACIDARRGEVFAAGAGIGPCAVAPEALAALVPAGAVVAGSGAVRYREVLAGADVPPPGSPLHVPWARHHAALRETAGAPEPVYLRAPDADRSLARAAP